MKIKNMLMLTTLAASMATVNLASAAESDGEKTFTATLQSIAAVPLLGTKVTPEMDKKCKMQHGHQIGLLVKTSYTMESGKSATISYPFPTPANKTMRLETSASLLETSYPNYNVFGVSRPEGSIKEGQIYLAASAIKKEGKEDPKALLVFFGPQDENYNCALASEEDIIPKGFDSPNMN